MPPEVPRIPAAPLSPGERAERDQGSSETVKEAARGERRALEWAAIAAVAAIFWIVVPVGVGILLGTLLAFALQPFFERLKPRLGVRWASLAIVLGTIVTVAGTIGGLAWLLVSKATTLTQDWIASLGPGGPGGVVLGAVGGLTGRLGVPAAELTNRARALAESTAAGAATVAEILVAATASSALALLFAMLSMHFILRNWQAIALGAQETFPLRPDYTAGLLAEFRSVGRSTLLGTIGTGLAQGVLATFGFWISGVPEPPPPWRRWSPAAGRRWSGRRWASSSSSSVTPAAGSSSSSGERWSSASSRTTSSVRASSAEEGTSRPS